MIDHLLGYGGAFCAAIEPIPVWRCRGGLDLDQASGAWRRATGHLIGEGSPQKEGAVLRLGGRFGF